MNLTKVERVEKGLDRDGLMKLNNDLDKATNDYRGLIYIEAKEDCSYTSMSWEKYLEGFIVEGKQINKDYANKLIKIASAKKELASENFKEVSRTLLNSLSETEAHIQLPDSERTCQSLIGQNAKQLLSNWNDVREATGKDIPSSTEVREYNSAKKEAKEKAKEMQNKASKKEDKKEKEYIPDPFTIEDEVMFYEWCKKTYGISVLEDKPSGAKAIYALKNERISILFDRLGEWKVTYKKMAKLCHPDHGGDSDTMSFLSDINELMKALKQVKVFVDYEIKIDELRKEYSLPKDR